MRRHEVLLVVAALALRLGLTATTIGTSDVIYKTLWMQVAERYGLFAAYAHAPSMNDPPLAVGASVVLNRISGATGIAFADLFRLVQVAADCLSLACLLAIGRRLGLGNGPGLFYFLAPPAILISGFHHNADPSMIAFVLLAVLLLQRERYAACGVVLAIATGVKVVPLLLFPLFFFAARRHALRFTVGWTAAMAVLYGIPAILGGPAVLRNTFLYRSVGNWWGIASMLHVGGRSDALHELAVKVGGVYRTISPILIVAAVLAIAFIFRRGSRGPAQLLAACGAVMTAPLVLGTGFGVQYLLWPVAFLPFLGKIRTIALAVSSLFLIVVYTHWSGGWPWWFADSDAPGATADWLVMLGWAVWVTLVCVLVAAVRRVIDRTDRTNRTNGTDGTLVPYSSS